MHSGTWILLVSAVALAVGHGTHLRLVQMLFRHGARAPITPYPTDPNPPESWPEGFESLTQLGKRQHYVLGKYLRSFYSDFVTSDPSEISVFSTVYDRCLKSALSNLASFYAPTQQWLIDPDLAWQPVPVVYGDPDKDRYLSMSSHCPRFFEVNDQRFNSTEFLAVVDEHRDTIDAMKRYGGVKDWQWACLLQDAVICEKAHGMIVPEWLDPYWDDLTELAEFAFYWLFNTFDQKRLRAGPLIEKLIENMDNRISGKSDLKVHMFSAHDANLVAILEALDLYWRRPPFAATLLVELHALDGGDHAVRLLYINSTTPEDISTLHANPLKLRLCDEFCPLERFRRLTKPLIPENWEEECKSNNISYVNEEESLARLFGSHELFGTHDIADTTAAESEATANAETTLG